MFAIPILDEGLIFQIYKKHLQVTEKDSPTETWAREMNSYFTKENNEIGNIHQMERCSTSLIIREQKNKMIMIYYLYTSESEKYKEVDKRIECWQRRGATRALT